jgi:hypothetical protein
MKSGDADNEQYKSSGNQFEHIWVYAQTQRDSQNKLKKQSANQHHS